MNCFPIRDPKLWPSRSDLIGILEDRCTIRATNTSSGSIGEIFVNVFCLDLQYTRNLCYVPGKDAC